MVQRAFDLLGEQLPPATVREIALVCRSLCWEFPDYGQRACLILSDDGSLAYVGSLATPPDGTFRMDAALLHQAAFGDVSDIALAFITGRILVTGAPAEELGLFLPLLEPFLASYRRAYLEYCGTQH